MRYGRDVRDEDLLLFDANPQPMWVFDVETLAFLLVNRATIAHYGWSRDELLAMTIRDIRPVSDQPLLDSTLARWRTDPKPHRQLTRHRTRDDRILEVELTLSPFEFRGRRAAHVIVSDLTGVAATDRRFRLLVEHSVDGIALVDEQGAIRYMSPGAERMLGLSHGELIGQSSWVMTHPDDIAGTASPRYPGDSAVNCTRSRHKDGSWRWLESISTDLTQDPVVRAFVVNFRDVTARLAAEKSLQQSEANFRELIERSPTAKFVHSAGTLVYVNPATLAMLGYADPSELVGTQVLSHVHPDDRELIQHRIRATQQRGGTTPGTCRMLRRDGSIAIVEAQGIRIDFDGQMSTLVIARNITERHELFARMAFADRMVSVGTLAAGVAHEINNPLAYVQANLEVLTNALTGTGPRLERDELAAVLADTREGVTRVAGIVNDLRALARPDDDDAGPVDVLAVLATSLKMAHHELRFRAQVVEAYAYDLPPVAASGSRLGQVFLNLLVNAAHAMREDAAATNELRLRAFVDDGRVCVEIEDTGVGMSPAVQQRIFDPFFTTKPPGVGSGLGLSISHQIVQSLGGAITVRSTPGQGSTFRVALPLANPIDPVPIVASPAPSAACPRVLMIDDEAAVGRSTTLLLAPEHEVVAVTRAQEALSRLAAGEHFDAILCDLMMPEMSGIEFYEEVLAIAPGYAPRIVLMTGGVFTPHAREFLAATPIPRLEKPFSEDALRAAITRAATAPR